MKIEIKPILNALLGISTEIIYALGLMATGFLICILALFLKGF